MTEPKLKLCWCDEPRCSHGWSRIEFNLFEDHDLPFHISADEGGNIHEWWTEWWTVW